jgi:hypothetical protein
MHFVANNWSGGARTGTVTPGPNERPKEPAHKEPTMRTCNDNTVPDIDRMARRRVAARMGWITHATVYVLVNAALAVAAFSTGRNWAIYPALGWGLGLVIHGLAVYLAPARDNLRKRMIASEKQKLMAHNPAA